MKDHRPRKIWIVEGGYCTDTRGIVHPPPDDGGTEPGLSPDNGLENALLSDQSMASNPRKGQAKRSGAKTTSHDGKAGHVMTHVFHCVRQQD
ncbi:TPA: hypothetical protein ACH3X2_001061 [Trebouxia sp. C0005]